MCECSLKGLRCSVTNRRCMVLLVPEGHGVTLLRIGVDRLTSLRGKSSAYNAIHEIVMLIVNSVCRLDLLRLN